MKKILLLFILPLFIITSCSDDKDDNSGGNNCSLVNGYLRANAAGVQYCADASLFADFDGLGMIINGISSDGQTLTIEIDSLYVGAHALNETTSTLIYTDALAMQYESTDDNPGTLNITSNNTSTNRIEGNFTVTVREPLAATSKTITTGTFSINYTE